MFQRKIQCLIPKAITPLQKALCVCTGIVSTGVAGTATYHGFNAWVDYAEEKNNRSMSTNKLRSMEERDQRRNRSVARGQMIECGSVVVIASSVGTLGIFFSYQESKKYFQQIKGTTECCNIIRTTMLYCVKLPLMASVTCGAIGLAGYLIYSFPQKYREYRALANDDNLK